MDRAASLNGNWRGSLAPLLLSQVETPGDQPVLRLPLHFMKKTKGKFCMTYVSAKPPGLSNNGNCSSSRLLRLHPCPVIARKNTNSSHFALVESPSDVPDTVFVERHSDHFQTGLVN